MRLALEHIFIADNWRSEAFNRFQTASGHFLKSRWLLLLLFMLGFLRAILFLAAYAPADGADAGDYYNYAAYMHGLDVPASVANVSPVYPYLIYIFYYLLGNLNLLLGFQIVLSSSLGVLIFLALRHYNPWLGLMAALLVLGDPQIGILFNFISTEPVYVFLLCLSFTLALFGDSEKKALRWQDVLLGLSLVLLRETRTVGAYLFIPILILFAFKTRNIARIGVLILSFAIGYLLFNTSMQVSGTAQAYSTNENMYMRPLIQANLLNAEAGESASHLVALLNRCAENYPEISRFSCMEIYEGNMPAVHRLTRDALIEVIVYDFPRFASVYFQSFHDFLTMTGQQYFGTEDPAVLQCENPSRAELNAERSLQEWVVLELSVEQQENFLALVEDYTGRLCPAWETNPAIQRLVEYIAFRYNSLSRPQPILFYGFFLVLLACIPWARKFWYPAFMAGGIWFYHAAISASVLNVQPRYVAVTNPFKAILLAICFYTLLNLALRTVDYFISRKTTKAVE